MFTLFENINVFLICVQVVKRNEPCNAKLFRDIIGDVNNEDCAKIALVDLITVTS